MELLAKVKVENIFLSKDYTDKGSGQITPGKWKVQTFDTIASADGEQMKLIDISVSNEMGLRLKSKVGEVVSIPVATFVSNGRVGFYGI